MKQIHSILIVLCAILNLVGSLKFKRDFSGSYYGNNYICFDMMKDCKNLIAKDHPEEQEKYFCDKITFTTQYYGIQTQYCVTKK